MAKFLRDEFLKNISITEETLTHINDYLSEREAITNVNTTDDKALLMTYIIRFDNRGYRLDDFLEVMNNYKRADSVERILFILESVPIRLTQTPTTSSICSL